MSYWFIVWLCTGDDEWERGWLKFFILWAVYCMLKYHQRCVLWAPGVSPISRSVKFYSGAVMAEIYVFSLSQESYIDEKVYLRRCRCVQMKRVRSFNTNCLFFFSFFFKAIWYIYPHENNNIKCLWGIKQTHQDASKGLIPFIGRRKEVIWTN